MTSTSPEKLRLTGRKVTDKAKRFIGAVRESDRFVGIVHTTVEQEVIGAPDCLQPSSFEDEFVGFYERELVDGKSKSEADKALAEKIRAYMESHKIQTDDTEPDFDEDMYDNVKNILCIAAEFTKEEWDTKNPESNKSHRDILVDELDHLFRSADQLAIEAEDTAKRYGELLRKRADKAGIFERTKQLESVQALHSDMLSAIATQMMIENNEKRADGDPSALSDDQLNDAIATFIDEQSNLFVAHMEQSRLEKSARRNRVTRFVTEKWASWMPGDPSAQVASRLFSWQTVKNAGHHIRHSYSKEHWKGTVAKNVVTAIGGATLTMALPAVAAAGAVGAAVGFVGARSARAYGIQKMNAAASADRVATAQRADIEARIAELRTTYEDTSRDFFDKLEDINYQITNAELRGDTDAVAELQAEKAQHIAESDTRSLHELISDIAQERAKAAHDFNRDRLLGGMAMGMLFGAAGTKLHGLIPENASQTMGTFIGTRVPEAAQEAWGNVTGFISRLTGHSDTSPQTPVSAPSSVDQTISRIHPNEGTLPSTSSRGDLPGIPEQKAGGDAGATTPRSADAPLATDKTQFNAKAFIDKNDIDLGLRKGEGFYSLARHFPGVSQAEMKLEMKSLAEELDAKYPKLVYFHNGEPRLSLPADGKLPAGAAEIIVEHFHAKGMLTSDGTMEVKGADAQGIRKGGGIVSEAKDYGIKDLTRDEINTLGEALTKEGTGYKSSSLADRFGSPYGIKLDVAGDDTPSGQFRPGADAIFRDFADDRTLNNSHLLKNAATANANAVDATVKAFAAEHGLSGEVDTIDELLTQAQSRGVEVPEGLQQVIAAGDVNKSGSITDEVQNYVNQFASNRTNFFDAMSDASAGRSLDKLSQYTNVIDTVGKTLSGLTYENPDGSRVPVAVFDSRSGHYQLSPMPRGIPEPARKLIQDAAFRADYRLAA